jgi:HK97 family phage portal protein
MTLARRSQPSLGTRLRYGLARWLVKGASFSVVPSWVTESFLKPTFRALTIDGYQRNSVVFACISAYTFALPEPPLLVYDGDSDGAKPMPKHPLRQLLRKPNPLMGEAELMMTTAEYLALGGNAYWHKVRGRSGRVVELYPYHAGNILPVPGGDTWIERYDFYEASGAKKPIPVEDIVHFKWPAIDPLQPWMAQPPLMAAARDVDTDNEVTRYLFALLKNDAIPRTVITVPSDRTMTDDEVRRTKEQWRDRYGGDNRGDVAILEGGSTVNRLGLNLEEMAFDALHRVPETRIAASFRVPPILAGLGAGLDASTYSNYEQARKAFTQDTLVGLWRLMGTEVTADLLSEFGGAVEARYDLSRVQALAENQDARRRFFLQAKKEGVLTKAETRRALGYPDKPAPGDEDLPPTPAGGKADAAQAQPILGYDIEAGVADVGERRAQLGLPEGETEVSRLKRLATALNVASAAVSFGVSPQDALTLVGLDLAVQPKAAAPQPALATDDEPDPKPPADEPETEVTNEEPAAKEPKTVNTPNVERQDEGRVAKFDVTLIVPVSVSVTNELKGEQATSTASETELLASDSKAVQPSVTKAIKWGAPDIEAEVRAAVDRYLAEQYELAAAGAEGTEKAVLTAANHAFERLRAELQSPKTRQRGRKPRLAALTKAAGDIFEQWGLDFGPGIRSLMARFYSDVLAQAYGDQMAALDIDRAFDLANPRVQDTLDELAQLVVRVSDTTREEIQQLVGRAADEGWGPAELGRRIREHGAEFSVARAEAIAATELSDAYTRGAILSWQDSGVVVGKEWLTTEGACPICGPLSGVVVGLKDMFDGGLVGPPAHTRCRCALIARV